MVAALYLTSPLLEAPVRPYTCYWENIIPGPAWHRQCGQQVLPAQPVELFGTFGFFNRYFSQANNLHWSTMQPRCFKKAQPSCKSKLLMYFIKYKMVWCYIYTDIYRICLALGRQMKI